MYNQPSNNMMQGPYQQQQNFTMQRPNWNQPSMNFQPTPNPPPTPAQPQYPSFPGRYVQSESEIKVNDIPMDGSLAIFPSQDLSFILLKAWNANGAINTVRYVVDPSYTPQSPYQDPNQQQIFDRLDKIEKALQASRNNKPIKTKEDS